ARPNIRGRHHRRAELGRCGRGEIGKPQPPNHFRFCAVTLTGRDDLDSEFIAKYCFLCSCPAPSSNSTRGFVFRYAVATKANFRVWPVFPKSLVFPLWI